LKSLLRFESLKTLKLVACPEFDSEGLSSNSPDALQENMSKIKGFLNDYKDNFGGKAPLLMMQELGAD
jgi:hypothetical protein